MVKRFLLGLFFILIAAASFADDIADYQKQSVNVLYRLRIDNDFYYLARAAGEYVWENYAGAFPDKEFWCYSLESILNSGENVAQVIRFADEVDTADPLEEATRRFIPIFVDISIEGNLESGRATVTYSFRELFSDLNVIEKTFMEYIPSEEDLLFYFWLPLSSDLNTFIKGTLKPMLTINAPAGAKVSGFTKEPFIMPGEGTVSIVAPMPTTFAWEMVHKKFTTRKGIAYVDKDKMVVDLPHQKFYPFSIDLGLYQACFPEAWFTWYHKSYGWFLSLGVQQQMYGLFAADEGTAQPLDTSFISAPLIMPGFAFGYRFRTAEPYIPKLYWKAVATARFNYEEARLDDFSPAGFSLSLGYEWETPILIKLFVELGASAYLLDINYKNSPVKGLNDNGFYQKVISDAIFLEMPVFKMGIKLQL
jgi:hypothetical protein